MNFSFIFLIIVILLFSFKISINLFFADYIQSAKAFKAVYSYLDEEKRFANFVYLLRLDKSFGYEQKKIRDSLPKEKDVVIFDLERIYNFYKFNDHDPKFHLILYFDNVINRSNTISKDKKPKYIAAIVTKIDKNLVKNENGFYEDFSQYHLNFPGFNTVAVDPVFLGAATIEGFIERFK